MAEIPAIKRRLVAQGVDVIDLGAGDADFPPPELAVETLARAARDPAMSRYPFQLGLPAFREAAAAYMQRRFGARFDPFTELHPLIGSKEGDRKSTRLNSSHSQISYAVFCLKKKKETHRFTLANRRNTETRKRTAQYEW